MDSPGFRLIGSSVEPLTLELATRFHGMEPSPTEREINPLRTKMLRQKADAGQLVTFHWSTAKLGEKVLRMNGQHSALMLTELNGAFPNGLKVHIDDYEVDSQDGLALLFRQFDDRKSGRTAEDVSGAYQGLFPDLKEVPRKLAKLGVEGVVYWRRHIEGLPVPSGDDAYTMFSETGLHPFLKWLDEVFTIKTPELKRVPIVAAMYSTFIVSEIDSRKFWADVARGGVEYEEGHPATVLDTWLKDIATKKDPDLKPANFYQACIYAWNGFREHKMLKDVKFDYRKGYRTAQ